MKNKLFCVYQCGFKANNHSIDKLSLSILQHNIEHEDSLTYMILIDLQKTYDSLCWFSEAAVDCFKSYLTKRKFFVSLNNIILSDAFTLNCSFLKY